jgi:hypothetical protein
MAIEWTWKLSTAGIVVSILTAILGALIWVGSEIWKLSAVLTSLQMEQTMLTQQNQNLSDALRQETAKREADEQNINRTFLLMSRIHEGGRR